MIVPLLVIKKNSNISEKYFLMKPILHRRQLKSYFISYLATWHRWAWYETISFYLLSQRFFFHSRHPTFQWYVKQDFLIDAVYPKRNTTRKLLWQHHQECIWHPKECIWHHWKYISDTISNVTDTIMDISDTIRHISDTIGNISNTIRNISDTVRNTSDTIRNVSDTQNMNSQNNLWPAYTGISRNFHVTQISVTIHLSIVFTLANTLINQTGTLKKHRKTPINTLAIFSSLSLSLT